jgi:hypothetical protein
VFSNLTRLREDTLRFAAEAGIHFATSVYSDDPAVHDAVTQVRSSHARTVGNLGRLIERGIATRAAIIRIGQEPAAIERTTAYLHRLGVPAVRAGDVRGFGRGQALLGEPGGWDGLCGHCWAGKLCVAPDGAAAEAAAREPAADSGGGGSRCGPADEEETCAPEELTGCEPLEPCEPEDQPSAGGTVGCDVVDISGPAPPPACPQSGPPPTTQPECPQSPEPCPQSPA